MSSYYSRYARSSAAGSRLHDSDVGGGAEPSYTSHYRGSSYASRGASHLHDGRSNIGHGHRPYQRASQRGAPSPPPPPQAGTDGPIAPGELLVCPIDDDDACSALTELTEQVPSPTSNRRGGRNFRPSFRPSFMSTLNEDDDDPVDRMEARSELRNGGASSRSGLRRNFEPSSRLDIDVSEPITSRFGRDRGVQEEEKHLVSNYAARRDRAREEAAEEREPMSSYRANRFAEEEEPRTSRGRLMSPKYEERRSSNNSRYQQDDMDDNMSVHSSARDRITSSSSRMNSEDIGGRRRFNGGEDNHRQSHHDIEERSVTRGREMEPAPMVIAFDDGVGPDRGAAKASSFSRGDSSVYSHTSRKSSVMRQSTVSSRSADHLENSQLHQEEVSTFSSPRPQRSQSLTNADIAKYECEVKNLEDALEEKKEEIEGLQDKINALETETQERLERRENELDRMKRSEDQNKADMKKVEERLKTAQEENLELRQDIAHLREELEHTSQDAEKHINSHEAKTQQIEAEYKRELEAMRHDLDDAHRQLDEKEEELKILKGDLAELEAQQKAKVNEMDEELRSANAAARDKDDEIGSLKQKVQDLVGVLDDSRANESAKLDELKNDLQKLKEENEDLRLTSKNSEGNLTRNQERIDSLMAELKKKDSDVEIMKRKNEELQQGADYDRCMLDRYRSSAENLQRQLDREKRDKETMKSFLQSEIDLLQKDKQRMAKEFEREIQESKANNDLFQRSHARDESSVSGHSQSSSNKRQTDSHEWSSRYGRSSERDASISQSDPFHSPKQELVLERRSGEIEQQRSDRTRDEGFERRYKAEESFDIPKEVTQEFSSEHRSGKIDKNDFMHGSSSKQDFAKERPSGRSREEAYERRYQAEESFDIPERVIDENRRKIDSVSRTMFTKADSSFEELRNSFEGQSLNGPADSYGDAETARPEWEPDTREIHIDTREMYYTSRH